MKSQIGEGGSSALRTRLDDAATLLESTAGSIENVMSELRPPMLDDYGLLPALQWYGNEFSRRWRDAHRTASRGYRVFCSGTPRVLRQARCHRGSPGCR